MECVSLPGESGIGSEKSDVMFYIYCKSSYEWIFFKRLRGGR